MPEVFIISAVRTPLAVHLPLAGPELAELVCQEAARRAGIDPGRLEDLVWSGCGQSRSRAGIQRRVESQSGITSRLAPVMVERGDLSSQQALHFAAQAILAGDADLLLTGGCELRKSKARQRSETGELEQEADLRRYRFESRERARQAVEADWFDRQLVPIPPRHLRDQVLSTMESPETPGESATKTGSRALDLEALPCSGAAALVLASTRAVGRLNLSPLARIAGRGLAGIVSSRAARSPEKMQPITVATRRVLQQAGLSLEEIDIFEIDEHCPAWMLDWRREFQLEMQRVNPTGGALAFGHPAGAAGAIWATRLVHELIRNNLKYGLLVGAAAETAAATLIERV